jgi:hypothetical protein
MVTASTLCFCVVIAIAISYVISQLVQERRLAGRAIDVHNLRRQIYTILGRATESEGKRIYVLMNGTGLIFTAILQMNNENIPDTTKFVKVKKDGDDYFLIPVPLPTDVIPNAPGPVPDQKPSLP